MEKDQGQQELEGAPSPSDLIKKLKIALLEAVRTTPAVEKPSLLSKNIGETYVQVRREIDLLINEQPSEELRKFSNVWNNHKMRRAVIKNMKFQDTVESLMIKLEQYFKELQGLDHDLSGSYEKLASTYTNLLIMELNNIVESVAEFPFLVLSSVEQIKIVHEYLWKSHADAFKGKSLIISDSDKVGEEAKRKIEDYAHTHEITLTQNRDAGVSAGSSPCQPEAAS
ncbi:hypothetical protein COLO4_37413 [Corchorus olitorius]|uniref:Uncharacterized protein n=1 Tax=Corchorus olitorius TaxID=93759 RepID=A0A1R3G248_9ROSI|nr:hypothetical protein COLO4_37413 [Corchorus olitorius]